MLKASEPGVASHLWVYSWMPLFSQKEPGKAKETSRLSHEVLLPTMVFTSQYATTADATCKFGLAWG